MQHAHPYMIPSWYKTYLFLVGYPSIFRGESPTGILYIYPSVSIVCRGVSYLWTFYSRSFHNAHIIGDSRWAMRYEMDQ